MGCHFLLHGIFLTQGSNPGLLHCRQILYPLSYQECFYSSTNLTFSSTLLGSLCGTLGQAWCGLAPGGRGCCGHWGPILQSLVESTCAWARTLHCQGPEEGLRGGRVWWSPGYIASKLPSSATTNKRPLLCKVLVIQESVWLGYGDRSLKIFF